MARIAGVDIPPQKRVVISLTYITGIGNTTAQKLVKTAGVNPDFVTGEEPREVGAGTIGYVGQDLGPVLELNPVHTVGKRLQDDPLDE